MRGTVLSQAFCDRLQRPYMGGLESVRLYSAHRQVVYALTVH